MPRQNQIVSYNRYAPYLRALGTGIGIAYTNRHRIKRTAEELRRRYDATVGAWRQRQDERAAKRVKLNIPAMAPTAGATNVVQRATIRQRSGKRVKRKSVNYLYRLQKATTSTAIQRFQNMSEYDSNGKTGCGYSRSTSGTLTGQYFYPVYVFDLTSCKMASPGGTSLDAVPFYRLSSQSATGNFVWSVQSGQDATGATSSTWSTEVARGVNTLTNAPAFGLNSMLAWSDIRLALYGATNQSTRFTVQFIQFTDECYQPRAAREDPAVPAAVTADVNDQQGRFDAAMEELVKPLVYHPLHVAGNATNVYRVLQSRSFTIQPDTSTNEGKASPNVCYKLFKRMNRICKWAWQTSDKKATTTSTEHKLKVDLAGGLDTSPDYNQFFGGTKKPYVHPNARVYMLITAQAYTRTGVQPDGSNVVAGPTNEPSFDMIVRNKWLYDAT